MKKKEPTMNYEIMFKSAVSKLKTDARTYNDLLQKWFTILQARYDDDGVFVPPYNFAERADALQTTLNMYKDELRRDEEEVKKYRKLKEAKHETDD